MKLKFSILAISTLTLMFSSCFTPKYFHDNSSFNRQKELKKNRSVRVFSNIAMVTASVFSEAVFETDLNWYPNEQKFKKLNLINPTSDTIYINMLTDVFWDDVDYCDFMDIRIPPKENCKIFVPNNALYNIYFSNTIETDDDELMEIYTKNIKKIKLLPGNLKSDETNNSTDAN